MPRILALSLSVDDATILPVVHLVGKGIHSQVVGGERTSFEVAAYDQGVQVTYLGPSRSRIGHKESMKDTARVLGRIYDGIDRGFAQTTVEVLAGYAGVPVWHGLANEFHPTQILADMLAMAEHSDKPVNENSFCYLGDARNNMGNSLMVATLVD